MIIKNNQIFPVIFNYFAEDGRKREIINGGESILIENCVRIISEFEIEHGVLEIIKEVVSKTETKDDSMCDIKIFEREVEEYIESNKTKKKNK